jgi:DNA-binding transcriptional regulator YdaS (Cro superfamily)
MSTSAVRAAADKVGGQAALARILGVKAPTVNEWVKGHARVPPARCPQIERATGGAVRCEDLRPDVAWDVLRMQGGGEGGTASAVAEA